MRPGGLTLTDRALEFCCLPHGSRLLDAGCGVGATVEHLSSRHGFTAAGVDISPELIAEGLLRNPALSLAEAAVETLPFTEESLDGVFCECVLSLLDQPLDVLLEFRRVLRSGGYLILSDMYSRGEYVQADSESGLPGLATHGQIEALLSRSGYMTLLWEDHTFLLTELAARLILAHGSLAGPGCGTTRPGYYLLVARKE